MSKITDASFIAHQYTSVSPKAIEKANGYSLFKNHLQAAAAPAGTPNGQSTTRPPGSSGNAMPGAPAQRASAEQHLQKDRKRGEAHRASTRRSPKPRAVPHPLPAGFPYFEISTMSAAIRSRHPGRVLHGLVPQPASQPSRAGRQAPFPRKAPDAITTGRRPCAAHPRGRWPPR